MSLTFERKDFDEMIKLIVDQAASRIVHEEAIKDGRRMHKPRKLPKIFNPVLYEALKLN